MKLISDGRRPACSVTPGGSAGSAPRTGHRHLPAALALFAVLLGSGVNPRGTAADTIAEPRILLHLVSATSKVASCTPGLTDCRGATTFGLATLPPVEFFYNAYVIVAGHSAAEGLREVKFAVDYEKATSTGVDVFAWNLCATSAFGPSDWYLTGAGNQIRWDDCPKSDVVVAGYFYVTAYSPGLLGIVPPPGAGPATVESCAGQPVELPLEHLGYAEFGGDEGCNSCVSDCHFVAAEPTTWSRLKAHFGAPSGSSR